MDKPSVLTRVLEVSGSSTLLGGELPATVITNNQFITPVTHQDQNQVRDRNVEEKFPSLDDALHAALSAEKKSVILVGSEGSGKTTALKKLVVDWARGERLQNFQYVFHFHISELTLTRLLSLEALMLHHQGLIPPESLHLVLQKPEDVLFVFDDLDQCKESLDASLHTLCSDPSQPVSVSCLVASLLDGSLLSGAAFVGATRSTGWLESVSSTQVEMLGFLKPQREAYFRGFFTETASANEALTHMENNLGFYEICTTPRFCWSVCSIYKALMDAGAELPETLTQLCVEILVHLTQTLSLDKVSCRGLVLALGRLASHYSINKKSSCTNEMMDAFGFQRFLSSAGSFLQVEDGCISFHCKMMQEFLLALSFFLDKSMSDSVEKMLDEHTEAKFLHMFLSGLSGPVQRRPLETLLGEMNPDRIQDFTRWFKSSSEATLKDYYKEKHLRCFHMLHQAQSETLVKEIFTPSARIGISYGDLSLQDCVPLNYVLTCLGEQEQLNLYLTRSLTEEKVERLTPAMCLSHKINFSSCFLSVGAVPHLASALSRGITKELNLSYSHFGYERFKLLCAGMRSSKLQFLNVPASKLTGRCCEDLLSVLTSGTSELSNIDFRGNEIGDQGLMKLCTALQSPHCKLQELNLQMCKLTAASMAALSAALCSGQSELRKVNLAENQIDDSGAEPLCKALQHPLCKLQSLNLYGCELTGVSCSYFMEALMSEHCRLSELDLSVNTLGQEGALLLCKALSRPGCPLQELGLTRCDLTEPVFKELGSLLTSGTSKLKSLNVGLNKVGDRGVKHLWEAVAHPNCLLENLDVEMTNLTDACLEDVCAAIRASRTLKSLEMRNNELTDESVPALVRVMQDSDNMLELNLKYNIFSEDVFEILDECEKIRY